MTSPTQATPGPSLPGDVSADLTAPDPTAPALTEAQERVIHRAASAMVAAAVRRQPVRLADATLSGAAAQPVTGAFVSLKRRGRLRGCCGVFGEATTVMQALSRTATRTATEDARLPPVSSTELCYLDLEVWLLYRARPMVARGEHRRSEISIGRHGLYVRRGTASGLLLPGVAVENGLDAEGFLEQVCLKANLPPTAWKEDDVHLGTFEGRAISAPLDPQVAGGASLSALMTRADLTRLADHCQDNIAALRRGSLANCYLTGAVDGTVYGVSMAVRLPDRPEVPRFSRLALRPGLPLQATLYGLVEAAERMLASKGVDAAGPRGSRGRVDRPVGSGHAWHRQRAGP